MKKYAFVVRLLIVVFLVFMSFELISSYIYFQRSLDKGIATRWFTQRLLTKFEVVSDNEPLSKLSEEEYRIKFSSFVEYVKDNNATLSVLYIPSISAGNVNRKEFFSKLCDSNGVRFWDSTSELELYSQSNVYNLPNDIHLSPFGHQLVANYLSNKISPLLDNETNQTSTLLVKDAMGPLPRNVFQVRSYSGIPFVVQTNSSGFRMSQDISNNMTNSIVILGDSFTYGTGVNTADTFPSILKKSLPNVEVINAGMPGIGLRKEINIYENLSLSFTPKLIVLQVLDNDLLD